MPDKIDLIGVNPTTGVVELAVVDDLSWSDYDDHMRWLIDKLNTYMGYILSGQMNESPAYSGRPAKIVVHFNGRPPKAARLTLLRVNEHLSKRHIEFAATESGVLRDEVDLERWSQEP